MATAEFSKFAGILSAELSQHHLLRFEKAQLEVIPSPPLALFIVNKATNNVQLACPQKDGSHRKSKTSSIGIFVSPFLKFPSLAISEGKDIPFLLH